MFNFLNDYNDKGHPVVYDYLQKLSEDKFSGYGQDDYTKKVKEKLKKEIENEDILIEFLAGGTIVNIVALTHQLRSYEAIVTAETGHVNIHETASIEATGHKLVTIPTTDGKLTAEILEKRLSLFGEETDVIPKVVYISNTTETGLVYTISEIKALHKVAKKYDCYLYIDGARLAVAMAKGDFTLKELAESCDYFTIGGTKNGALFGEILVIVHDELKVRLRHHMKQKGSILAKGFLLAAQFDALFEEGLYYNLGQHSLEMAERLAKGLKKLEIEFTYPAESNQLFVKWPEEKIENLEEIAAIGLENLGGYATSVRFCTHYRNTEEEIDDFLEKLKEIL